jgi:hypothetical protein
MMSAGTWGLPKTLLGRWSVALAAVFFIFMAVFFAVIAAGVRGGETYWEEWRLSIPFTSAAICGIGSAGTGLTALFRKGERSLLVILATMLGLFVAFFVVGEVFFPH